MTTFYRLLVLGAMTLPAASASFAQETSVKILIKDNKTVGAYLADENGRTMYWKKGDSPGKSTCTGPCLQTWPAINLPASVMLPPGLKASDFSRMTREDGSVQSTFRRYPIYYYVMDREPGDTKGQGVNREWYVINPDHFPPVNTDKLYGRKP